MYLRRFSCAGGRPASTLQRRHQLIKAVVQHREALLDRLGCPEPTERCVLPTPGGPWIRTVSALRTHAQVASVSMRERSIAGWKAKSKFSSVWPVGRPDSLSEVFTRRPSRPDCSIPAAGPGRRAARIASPTASVSKMIEMLGRIGAAQRQQPLAGRVDIQSQPAARSSRHLRQSRIQIDRTVRHGSLGQFLDASAQPPEGVAGRARVPCWALIMRLGSITSRAGVPRGCIATTSQCLQDLHLSGAAAHLDALAQ